MTCRRSSSAISWPFAMARSRTLSRRIAMAVELLSPYVQHGLDCMKGGLIKPGHNDIRDFDARLADVAWGGVAVEPVMVPVQDGNNRPTLQADWLVRGVWEGDRVAYFDNRIVDADAPSYVRSNLSWNAVSNSTYSVGRFCSGSRQIHIMVFDDSLVLLYVKRREIT